MNILMQGPTSLDGPVVIPGQITPSGNSYTLDPSGQISVLGQDVSLLLGLGFVIVGAAVPTASSLSGAETVQITQDGIQKLVPVSEFMGGSGLVGFTATLNTAPPNDSVNVSQLAATGGTSPQSVAITVAQDGGAFSLASPTGDPTGGNVRGFAAVDLQTFPSGKNSATQVASGTYASIGGGGGNTASGFGSTVGGGNSNSAIEAATTVGGGSANTAGYGGATVAGGENNAASGSEATIGGGNSNQASGPVTFVGGGQQNQATNDYDVSVGGLQNQSTGGYSFAGGGYNNIVSGSHGVGGGGEDNTISGSHATVAGGLENTADGEASWCPGGYGGAARGIYGRGSFGSGWITTPGDAALGVLPIRAATSDATPTVLTSTNTTPSATNQLVLPDNSTFGFHGWVLGRNAGTASSYWTFSGIIERGTGAGSVAIGGSGTITPTLVDQDSGASTWSVAVTADTSNGGLAVTVTGAVSTNITWNCRIETEELVD